MASIAAARPTAMPACGPPSSLSPLKVTMSAPAATLAFSDGSSANRGTVGEGAAAEVVDEHRAEAVGQGRQLLQGRLGGEPDDAVVAGVHAQHRPRAGVPGVFEVAQVGAVGGADLDQLGAALAQDVGDAKAVADLDQLAARHQHLAAAGGGGQRQQHRRGVVVDHERVFGAGDGAEHVVDVILARGTGAARQAVLQVGVAARGRDHCVDRLRRQHARPRLVCTTTPPALMTRRSDGVTAAASRRATQGTRSAGARPAAAAAGASPASSPARISARSRSITVRTASTTRSCG